MKIPLSDSIWTRLYGPYGLDEITHDLRQLDEAWDENLATELFWERLHHQDDLYPITFAALPWLWACAPRSPSGSLEALAFFSHVIYCATASYGTGCDGQGPRGRYRGLSLKTEDHRLKWIPEAEHLLDQDMTVLEKLEGWFTATMPEIADVCIRAVPNDDRYDAAALSKGVAALHGGREVAVAVDWWADDQGARYISKHPPAEQDRAAARGTLAALGNRNHELADFLRTYAACGP